MNDVTVVRELTDFERDLIQKALEMLVWDATNCVTHKRDVEKQGAQAMLDAKMPQRMFFAP